MAQPDKDYLKYIPNICENPKLNAIVLTTIPAILYTAAAFGHLHLKQNTLLVAILISILFACLEYVVRVPIVKYSSNEAQMSNTTIQVIWIILTLVFAYMSDFIVPDTAEKKSD